MEKILEIVLTGLLLIAIGIPLLVLLVYITGAAIRLLYQSLRNFFSENIKNGGENQQSWIEGYRERNM